MPLVPRKIEFNTLVLLASFGDQIERSSRSLKAEGSVRLSSQSYMMDTVPLLIDVERRRWLRGDFFWAQGTMRKVASLSSEYSKLLFHGPIEELTVSISANAVKSTSVHQIS